MPAPLALSKTYLSRRALMRTSASALLAAGLWPGALSAADAAAPDFPFLWVNDFHLFDENCVPFFQRAVDKMKEASPKAELFVVGGDLTEKGTAKQHDLMLPVLKSFGLKPYYMCGNHDWSTQTDRKGFLEACPDSLNYTFEHRGWQFLVFDSSDGTKSNVSVLKPTLDYLDETLPKLDKKKPLVLMTHFPLGTGVQNKVQNAEAILNRFKEFNLRGVFGGHYHASTERAVGDYIIGTNRCCSFRANNHDGSREKGFLACETKDGKIIRKFVEVSVAAPATRPAA